MIETGFPCPYCAVRPDVGCRHREAIGVAPVHVPKKDKRNVPRPGNGLRFQRFGADSLAAAFPPISGPKED